MLKNGEIKEYIKYMHEIYPLVGCDIGAIRHSRIVSVLKKFPGLDYMDVSHEMDKLDDLDRKEEKRTYEEWAKRCI